MNKIQYILGLVLVFLFLAEASITPCPSSCTCNNSICRWRRKAKKVLCTGVAVSCSGQNLTEVPEDIPLNVTGLLLSNNNITSINLDDFEKFSKLSTLVIDNNNATELLITKSLKKGGMHRKLLLEKMQFHVSLEIPSLLVHWPPPMDQSLITSFKVKLRKLSLSGNHLVSLPMENLIKLKKLSQLHLSHNGIQDVRYIRFPRKLEILNLNNNNMETLSGGTFSKLKRLRVLKLNNNSINHINAVAFKHLHQLETIELEFNALRQIPKDAFAPLSNGWYINLKNNRITEVHPLSFRLFGYKNLNHHQIHLENNNLRFIERDMLDLFVSRQKRYSFYFGANPIFCDCNLINLRNEAGDLFGDGNKMLCNSPVEYNTTNMLDLQIDNCCF